MNWHKVCNTRDFDIGEMKAFNISAIDFILIRSVSGFVAIPPSCPHMANSLVEGFFDGSTLTCDKHLWQWDLPSGAPIGEAQCPLLQYEIECRGDEIWIDLKENLFYDHEA